MSLKFTDITKPDYERILVAEESISGFYCITAIHNTKRGPALGGCRYFNYKSNQEQETDVLNLSKAMTYKNSLANLDFGGGKATVNAKVSKSDMYELFAEVLNKLDGTYITAGDIGMVDEDLVNLKKYSKFVCSTLGTDSGQSTAYGVFNAMLGYNEFANNSTSLENKKIIIKGYGKVGSRLANFCKAQGALIEIVDFEQKKNVIEEDGYVFISDYKDTHFNEIDIFSPCATGGDLNNEFINFIQQKKVHCILGAANNQLANPSIEKQLHELNVVYCPDYCVNAGGVIILALRSSIKEDLEYADSEAKQKLIGIKDQLKNILKLSKTKNQLSTVSSNELAERGFLDR